MIPSRWKNLSAAAVFIAAAAPLSAIAHHGWAWTTGENRELTGTIVEVRLGNPHGELDLDVDGETWTVEVGQPWRNERAGIKDGDFAKGVEVRVSGEASADDKLLKVERLWLNGNLHELYPNRD